MADRPNILFIMADDHASKAISCYGAGINHTPNIDRLAEEGMKFNHCYVTNSICTPSRAAILTGTHNHVNQVYTLDSKLNNRLPNVAKHLRSGGYQTAMIGKWHLGEGRAHEPTGFDFWSVIPGQGAYYDPEFIEMGAEIIEEGYATDIITNKSLAWLKAREPTKPFFLMCHHKAPHRSWEFDEKHRHLYTDPIKFPDTFTDDYKNRAKAAKVAKMRIADDLTYFDLGLAQPNGGNSTVGAKLDHRWSSHPRKVPSTTPGRLIDSDTGAIYTFSTPQELAEFKYQRYMQRYLRTIASIDDNVGRLLDYLDREALTSTTVVIYTSDQGFFLGEHGWFDKRFMYEESFQMPLLIRYPRSEMNPSGAPPGAVCDSIVSNVDFAPTFLALASLTIPSYMQGYSFLPLLHSHTPPNWQTVAYHRYWMHRDSTHEAYAHYGIRDKRYKLIYWYNEGFGIEGTREGGQEREWELFDCERDPLELFNVYGEEGYREVVGRMTGLLEGKMDEIGDECVHERVVR